MRRINITADPALLHRLDEWAERAGVNRSLAIAALVTAQLDMEDQPAA